MVRLARDAQYRMSKRGLVLAGESGETVLFEHPRAAELAELLAEPPILPSWPTGSARRSILVCSMTS